MSSWIVCGFYTPDYRHWTDKLIASLDAVGAPHDIVVAEKRAGGWEANTMAKAGQVLAAMDRHPSEVVIFLDVDCEVHGDLSPLASIRGDIGLFMPVKRKADGSMTAVRFKPHSGTLVIQPTSEARRFVETWATLSRKARRCDVDQTTLALAMNSATGVAIELLHPKWCATPGYTETDAVIRHDEASLTTGRMGKVQRWLMGSVASARMTG